jgi:hypothetical protein
MFFNFNSWDFTIRVLECCSLTPTLRGLREQAMRFEISLLKSNDVILYRLSTFYFLFWINSF